MIANMALALAGLIDYRSLTLRTRGVHLHLRVVATRRYSKSYRKRFHGDWRAATAAPGRGSTLHTCYSTSSAQSSERREGVEPFAELHLLRRRHRAVVLASERAGVTLSSARG